jgi:hypothetical protein
LRSKLWSRRPVSGVGAALPTVGCLFTHLWRYDLRYRWDVPVRSWWDLHRFSAELEHQTRIPPSRFQSTRALKVLSLCPAAELDVGMGCLVPARVRVLLAEVV